MSQAFFPFTPSLSRPQLPTHYALYRLFPFLDRVTHDIVPSSNHCYRRKPRAPSKLHEWTREAARLLLAVPSSTTLYPRPHILIAIIDQLSASHPSSTRPQCLNVCATTVFATTKHLATAVHRNLSLAARSKHTPRPRLLPSSPSSPRLFQYQWPSRTVFRSVGHSSVQPLALHQSTRI